MNIDNTIFLTGIVGKPMSVNAKGTVGTVSIAVKDTGKDKDGNHTTSWVNLKFLGENNVKAAEKNLDKGVKVRVVGELDVKSSKGDDGKWTSYVNVNVIAWRVEGKSASSDNGATEQRTETPSNDGFMSIPSGGSDDFLPFA